MSFLDLFRANTMPGQNAVAPIMQPNVAMFGSMAPPQPTNWMQPQPGGPPGTAFNGAPVGQAPSQPGAGYFGLGTTDSPTPMAMGYFPGSTAQQGMNGKSFSGAPMPVNRPTPPPAGNPRLYSPRAQAPTAPPSPAFMPGAQQSSPSVPLAAATSGQETPTNWMTEIASALGNPGASGGGGSIGGGIASMPGAESSPGQGIGGGGAPTNWMQPQPNGPPGMGGGGLSNPLGQNRPTNWKQPSLFGGK